MKRCFVTVSLVIFYAVGLLGKMRCLGATTEIVNAILLPSPTQSLIQIHHRIMAQLQRS